MIIKKGFVAEGTTCKNCEKIIKKQAMKIEGVENITFDYSNETGFVKFDDKKTDIDEILSKIEEKDYTCFILEEKKKTSWVPLTILIAIIGVIIINFTHKFNLPSITENMSYGLLFVVGLLTGLHCIGMCGGFVVSYSIKNPKKISHFWYALGKTASYTIIGGLFGLLGSIIAFTPKLRSIIAIFAGIFLILFGIKTLNLLPILRKLNIKTPKFISKIKSSSPLIIGLLNGLMIACGPLQAMYVLAAGTGSFIEGAKLLFIFGLGTLPAMLGFGLFTSFISGKVTKKILKASGIIVIILGLIMINNGLTLTGSGLTISKETKQSTITQEYQEIHMTVDRYGWTPDRFILKKDIPVKWIIDGKEITGCNRAIQVPDYNLEFDIKQGKQTIEFTPTKTGVIKWSCWMGMIPGTFVVE